MNITFGKDGSGINLDTSRGAVKRENVDQYQNVYCWEFEEDRSNGVTYVRLRDNFILQLGEKWRIYQDSSERLVLEFYDGSSWNNVTYFQGS